MENTEEQVNHEVTIYAEPIFHVGNFQITNALITSWLAVIVIGIFALIIRLKMKKIPGKFQHVFEVILEGAMSLCDQVTNDRKITKKIFPLVFTLFVFILVNNWIGLLPFVSAIGFYEMHEGTKSFVPLFRAGTADINFTLAFSLLMVLVSNIFGIVVLGVWKVLNKYVNIKSLGSIFTKIKGDKSILIVAPITFFVGLLELVAEIAKIASLSFRLFGNVFAGEVLLASMSAIFIYILPGPFLFLEVFVGLIQALIFSLLTAVYFTIAAQDHSEHEEHEAHGHNEEKEMAHV
ncbi:MAG: F0F1 ATP synthase subunit A [bacterium]|nr:F0F1 ATP synthase subunit A [bacterium]